MAVRLTRGGAAIFMPPRLGAAVNSPAQALGKEENQMKKYAFFLMGQAYQPRQHQASFETAGMLSHIFTVRTLQEAVQLAERCKQEGFGAIDLCGAFGPQGAREIIRATGGQIAVGYVTHFPGQDGLFDAFFG